MSEFSFGPPPDTNKRDMACPACESPNPDWLRVCRTCGQELRTRFEATRAEADHIVYLQEQILAWQERNIIPASTAERLQAEYRTLLAGLPAAPTPWDGISPAAVPTQSPPAIPRLSSALPPALPSPAPASAPPVSAPVRNVSRPAWGAAKAAAGTPRQPAHAAAAPPPVRRNIEILMQAHGLKLVFTLASLLVLFALRSLIAWQAVGAIAVRLLPLFLVGLTAMFWAFGERTRTENSWAGFVFHGMAVLLIGFDVIAVNRYWLEPTHLGIPLKPMLLVAALAATAAAGMFLRRSPSIPYLHLVQTGIVLSLYSALQTVRLVLWNTRDFHAAPLPLFSVPFLLLADLHFWQAKRVAGTKAHAGAAPVYALWAHLCIAILILLVSANVLLSDHVGLLDYAALAGLTALMYALGAQMLDSGIMAYVSGSLALAACALWLGNAFDPLWSRLGLLLLAIGAAAYALDVYNTRRSNRKLAEAWSRIARVVTGLAAALICGQIVFRWTATWVHAQTGTESVTSTIQAILCSALLFVLARTGRSTGPLYGSLASAGLAIVSLLDAGHAAIGAYALTLALYGGALVAAGARLQRRQNASRAPAGPAVPLPQSGASSPATGWPEPRAFLQCGHAALAGGLLIAALLPINGLDAGWLWSSATLALGCAAFAATAQVQQSVPAVYASLLCLAYATALTVWKAHPAGATSADILSPFALSTGLASLVLARRAISNHPISGNPPAAGRGTGGLTPDDNATGGRAWKEALAVMSLLAAAFGVLSALLSIFSPHALAHIGPSLLLPMLASLVVCAGRNEARYDTLRISSVCLVNLTSAVAIAAAAGLARGSTYWTLHAFQNASIGWIAQAWMLWVIGALFSRSVLLEKWSATAAGNATAAALMTAVLTAGAGWSISRGTGEMAWTGALVMLAAYLVTAAEAARTREAPPRWAGLAVYGLGAAYFGANVYAHGWYPAISWTLFSGLAILVPFVLACRAREQAIVYDALLPLVLGFGLFLFWKTTPLLPRDRSVADVLWLFTGIAAGVGYVQAARSSGARRYGTLAALVWSAAYCHMASAFWHLRLEGYALALLPFTTSLYLAGCRTKDSEQAILQPFRQTALAVSAAALAFCTVYGDCLAQSLDTLPTHRLITETLAAYAAVYTVLAIFRCTPVTAAAASWALTTAWTHGLLEHTAYWRPDSDLSYTRFSLLLILPAVLWIAIAAPLDKMYKRADLARPLVLLTGVLAAVAALITLSSHRTAPEGDMATFVLVAAAAMWAALWALRTGELCWHVGVWNVLAAWMLYVSLHTRSTDVHADIYLLPFGFYLLIIGHRADFRNMRSLASRAWWMGLLLILAPAFVLYWTHAPGPHAVLLVIECAAAALWGFARHIRPYASAGLGFAMLLTAASILGHLPDYGGTFLALGIGVALFVMGFYVLTHRGTAKQWIDRLNAGWSAWR